jgi:hypothetical protein
VNDEVDRAASELAELVQRELLSPA